jgi:hypothetical protein
VVVLVVVAGYLLVTWTGALLATIVAWPARAVSGNWLVVAYLLDPPDGNDRWQSLRVAGRTNAEAIVRQWALDIKEHGQPRAATGSGRDGVGVGSG